MDNQKPQPIVFRKSKRIYLSPILEADIPLITVWINDWDIAQNLTVCHPLSFQDEKQWFEGLSKNKTENVILAIRLVETDEIIGATGLHRINNLHGTATTGSYIGRKDLHGKGYGTEAKMLLLEYAFNTLNLRKVKAEVYDFNKASQKSLAKCGYKQEGVFVKDRYRNGKHVDSIQMAVFKDDFLVLWKSYQDTFLK